MSVRTFRNRYQRPCACHVFGPHAKPEEALMAPGQMVVYVPAEYQRPDRDAVAHPECLSLRIAMDSVQEAAA